ncbi:MAG TPA: AI-2E family transporter [Candidatus Saccharimonadales bacterium]|nr:AI-2E family transporter [Candidatus Saccharimonadales bacterium]
MQTFQVENRTIFRILTAIAGYSFIIFLAYLLRRELAWVGAAFFLAVALDPAVTYLAKYMPRRSRGLSTGAVFALFLLVLSFLVYSFLPPLMNQTRELIKRTPAYVDEIQHAGGPVGDFVRSNELVDKAKEAQSDILSQAGGAGGSVVGVIKNIFSGVAASLTVLALTFFMLLEAPQWTARFWALYAPTRRTSYQKLSAAMYRAMTGYVTGNLLTSLIAAALTAGMLAVLRVPYAIPLGIVVGIFDLLPLIGATLGALSVLIVALFTSPTAALVMLVFFVLYQQVENHILQPIVYGRTIRMSPLLVLVAAILGASLGGILGAFVAIPITASIKILIAHILEERSKAKS